MDNLGTIVAVLLRSTCSFCWYYVFYRVFWAVFDLGDYYAIAVCGRFSAKLKESDYWKCPTESDDLICPCWLSISLSLARSCSTSVWTRLAVLWGHYSMQWHVSTLTKWPLKVWFFGGVRLWDSQGRPVRTVYWSKIKEKTYEAKNSWHRSLVLSTKECSSNYNG